MILLFGGTTESADVALALCQAGHRVLVSQATDVPLRLPRHPSLKIRRGALDQAQMLALIEREKISALVDVAHPFATQLHATLREVARRQGLPLRRLGRASGVRDPEAVHWADHHPQAARLAASFGKDVLLTTGSRHLDMYVAEARARGVQLYARVLDHPTSLDACRRAGLRPNRVIAGRPPYAYPHNLDLIQHLGVGVLVTKDSGDIGGVEAKIRAAQSCACEVVVLRQPMEPGEVDRGVADLIAGLEGA